MDLNILNPKTAVQRAFDKPHFPTAIMLVILPAIISLIGYFIAGLNPDLPGTVFSVIFSIVVLLVLSITLYVISFIIEGPAVKGKFLGIVCSLSLVWILVSIAAVLGILLVAFVLPQEVTKTISGIQNSTLGSEETTQKITELMENSVTKTNTAAVLVFSAIGLLLTLFAFAIIFLTIADLHPNSRAKQIIIFIIFLAIIAGLSQVTI